MSSRATEERLMELIVRPVKHSIGERRIRRLTLIAERFDEEQFLAFVLRSIESQTGRMIVEDGDHRMTWDYEPVSNKSNNSTREEAET